MSDPGTERTDPLELFRAWMSEAEASEINDPNAVALATATRDGHPSVRMVLIKQMDDRGFRFFTNAESQKGRELRENARAALCFHWKSLRRQVRVEGTITDVPVAESDAYFHSRSRRSQLGAAVSHQSHPLESRDFLERLVTECDQRYPGEIPRPAFWQGYCLSAEHLEFWSDGPDRLHDRLVYDRGNTGWAVQRLYP